MILTKKKRCFDQWNLGIWRMDTWLIFIKHYVIPQFACFLVICPWIHHMLNIGSLSFWERIKTQHFDQKYGHLIFFFWCFKPKARQDHPGTREIEVYGGPVLICDRCASGAVPEVPYGAMCYAERFFLGHPDGFDMSDVRSLGESGWNSKTSAFVGKILLNNSLVSIGYTSISPSG